MTIEDDIYKLMVDKDQVGLERLMVKTIYDRGASVGTIEDAAYRALARLKASHPAAWEWWNEPCDICGTMGVCEHGANK